MSAFFDARYKMPMLSFNTFQAWALPTICLESFESVKHVAHCPFSDIQDLFKALINQDNYLTIYSDTSVTVHEFASHNYINTKSD